MIVDSVRQGHSLQRRAGLLWGKFVIANLCGLLCLTVLAGEPSLRMDAPAVLTPPEMEWVFLPAGYEETCVSETECSTGQVCFGLQYTPGLSGTLISYTTGFFLDCVNGNNPVVSNASCVMTDNSEVIDICSFSDSIYINCSGHTGSLEVTAMEPVILHQICLQLSSGETTNIIEDVVTNLTTTISLAGGGTEDEQPSFESYLFNPDSVCLQPPGNILGFVSSTAGVGIISVNLRLF
jgi:hypothetical protein